MKEKVEKTITIFNLKHPSLIERRKTIIQYIRIYADGLLDTQTIKTALSSFGFISLVEQYCPQGVQLRFVPQLEIDAR